ncbi:hypothetical protein Slin15195_G065290 [Septoria linicola]|uniref:Xylanolytic transcriptional activator regulatory domain-containing protein n=1 Tax=Septoria linicola TaxID=215465 RepID=A0A9Q9AQG1_9PEZI|nr:hypothetical protein Slin14017_G115630 [Septoria linicola]USW53210.1 hypothetical protein Slin15195_G065290 [Septoria linicola]
MVSRDWNVFRKGDPIRVLYVGAESSNLYQLVKAEGTVNTLHYPFPAIKPPLPWKPASGSDVATHLTHAGVDDVGNLPPRKIQDALIETFFTHIYPGFPILDAQLFLHQYHSNDDDPPLLLLQSVLVAAARISHLPTVANSRPAVAAALFRRAKALFDMRHENDRVHLVQAAMLLTWHSEDADTVAKNVWHWTAQAVRIAFGLGMHRDLSATSRTLMPDADKREYRRCWWISCQVEALFALKFGRPSMIRREDYDQPALTSDDFQDLNGKADERVNVKYCILNSELAEVALEIGASLAPRSARNGIVGIDEHLANIGSRLPSTHDFWSCQLRLNYSMINLTTLRTREGYDNLLLAQDAASSILTTFECMSSQGTIRMCQPLCAPTLFAATLQFVKTIKHAVTTGNRLSALSAHAQMERLLGPIEELAVYCPNVGALQKLCITLTSKCSRMIREQRPADTISTADESQQAYTALEDLMASFDMPYEDLDFDAADWTNAF